jgi:hypothetical protein
MLKQLAESGSEQGFGDQAAKDDAEIGKRASFMYDAILVHLRRRLTDATGS